VPVLSSYCIFIICTSMTHGKHITKRWHIVSRPCHCSYLKLNKISKSEGIKKVEYTYYFLKACWCCLPKIIKISPCLSKLLLAKVGAFLRHSVVSHSCMGSYFFVFYSREKYSMFQSRSGMWMKAGIGLAILTTLGLILLRYFRSRT